MKVSRTWLQKYFAADLPSVEELAELLTFHAFEIEEAHGDLLDVKILPDRAAYALSHRGIAKEVAALVGQPVKEDPLRMPLPEFPTASALSVSIEDGHECFRYMGAIVRGVSVGPSPAWLKEALEAVGQRSINNVVDATNYVMLNIGQPLHAFDAARLGSKDGKYAIAVRGAFEGEKITTLSGDEYVLPEGTLLIVDAAKDTAVGIAGVKGGKAAEITEATTDIVIESANFNGPSVRRSAQTLKLFTDASARFQNRISPELAAYGMRDVLTLIQELAGGTLEGVTDVRAGLPQEHLAPISVSLEKINKVLGSEFGAHEVAQAFDRLDLPFREENRIFTVTPPFERRDLQIPEDLIEEAGRILGYQRIASHALPALPVLPDQLRYRAIERIKDVLIERGFTEISTPAFSTEGDIALANPLQEDRPWLRASLSKNMQDAVLRATQVAPRVLGPDESVRLFEIGNVFTKEGEEVRVCLGYHQLSGKKRAFLVEIADALTDLLGAPVVAGEEGVVEIRLDNLDLSKLAEGYEPERVMLQKFRQFSLYPSALRDIAVWSPVGTEETEVANAIISQAGDLLARIDLFDRFEKDGRVSHAFRLVFESSERTLSDTDLNPTMERITTALNGREGWQVR
ncbi:MAG TPA: phenylalanine--tRNA ligase subunit beta [Candidatus Paceibacterota bacterium]|nr:phenylalanine--tRNA ligase subunit beta [Candidatus Paceibacterota bacterium]